MEPNEFVLSSDNDDDDDCSDDRSVSASRSSFSGGSLKPNSHSRPFLSSWGSRTIPLHSSSSSARRPDVGSTLDGAFASPSSDQLTPDCAKLRQLIVEKKCQEECVNALHSLLGTRRVEPDHLQGKDPSGKTLLYWACYLEQKQVVQALLQCGVLPGSQEVSAALSGKYGEHSMECLQLVLESLAVRATREERLAVLNSKENDWDGTALHFAIQNGCLRKDVEDTLCRKVEMLLEARADVMATYQKGATALHKCAREGLVDVARCILKHAKDPRALAIKKDGNGHTARDIAVESSHDAFVSMLDGEMVIEPPMDGSGGDEEFRRVAAEHRVVELDDHFLSSTPSSSPRPSSAPASTSSSRSEIPFASTRKESFTGSSPELATSHMLDAKENNISLDLWSQAAHCPPRVRAEYCRRRGDPMHYVQVAFMGNAKSAAKTSLIERYIWGTFKEEYDPTTVQNCYCVRRTIRSIDVCFDILDTSGLEAYRLLQHEQFFQAIETYAFAYGATDPSSLQALQSHHLVQLMKHRSSMLESKVPFVVLCNKMDLIADSPYESAQDPSMDVVLKGRALSSRYGVPFVETSCKTGRGVDECFSALLEQTLESRKNSIVWKLIEMLQDPSSSPKSVVRYVEKKLRSVAFFEVFEMYYPSVLIAAILHAECAVIAAIADRWPNLLKRKHSQALHYAVAMGRPQVVKLLLRRGADATAYAPSVFNVWHDTLPIHEAAEYGYEHCLRVLLSWTHPSTRYTGPSPSDRPLIDAPKRQYNSDCEDSTIPLRLAASNGNRECCVLLLKYGADPSYRCEIASTQKHHVTEEVESWNDASDLKSSQRDLGAKWQKMGFLRLGKKRSKSKKDKSPSRISTNASSGAIDGDGHHHAATHGSIIMRSASMDYEGVGEDITASGGAMMDISSPSPPPAGGDGSDSSSMAEPHKKPVKFSPPQWKTLEEKRRIIHQWETQKGVATSTSMETKDSPPALPREMSPHHGAEADVESSILIEEDAGGASENEVVPKKKKSRSGFGGKSYSLKRRKSRSYLGQARERVRRVEGFGRVHLLESSGGASTTPSSPTAASSGPLKTHKPPSKKLGHHRRGKSLVGLQQPPPKPPSKQHQHAGLLGNHDGKTRTRTSSRGSKVKSDRRDRQKSGRDKSRERHGRDKSRERRRRHERERETAREAVGSPELAKRYGLTTRLGDVSDPMKPQPSSHIAADAPATPPGNEVVEEGRLLLAFLEELALAHYFDTLVENEVTSIDRLSLLDASDLAAPPLSMKLGARKVLLHALSKLNSSDSHPSTPSGGAVREDSILSSPSPGGSTTPPPLRKGDDGCVLEKAPGGLIDYATLSVSKVLGRGSFGVVRKGRWRGHVVAVKEAKNIETTREVEAFMREATLMANVPHHPCVVDTYGACRDVTKPLAIVVEYAIASLKDVLWVLRGADTHTTNTTTTVPAQHEDQTVPGHHHHLQEEGGSEENKEKEKKEEEEEGAEPRVALEDINSHPRPPPSHHPHHHPHHRGSVSGGKASSSRSSSMSMERAEALRCTIKSIGLKDDQDTILGFAQDVAKGMEFLHQHGIVHRDLALRNVLFGADGRAKVGDFGMSRAIGIQDAERTRSTVVPIRWCAPETQQRHGVCYSVYTDVWAYGVTVWEMYTLEMPYADFSSNFLAFQHVLKGNRLPMPQMRCTAPVFSRVMRPCWKSKPTERPTFTTILEAIDDIRRGASSSISMESGGGGGGGDCAYDESSSGGGAGGGGTNGTSSMAMDESHSAVVVVAAEETNKSEYVLVPSSSETPNAATGDESALDGCGGGETLQTSIIDQDDDSSRGVSSHTSSLRRHPLDGGAGAGGGRAGDPKKVAQQQGSARKGTPSSDNVGAKTHDGDDGSHYSTHLEPSTSAAPASMVVAVGKDEEAGVGEENPSDIHRSGGGLGAKEHVDQHSKDDGNDGDDDVLGEGSLDAYDHYRVMAEDGEACVGVVGRSHATMRKPHEKSAIPSSSSHAGSTSSAANTSSAESHRRAAGKRFNTARSGWQDPRKVECKYGFHCKRMHCHFYHPGGRAIDDPSYDPAKRECMFGYKCKRVDCHFAHPTGRAIDQMTTTTTTATATTHASNGGGSST